MARNFTIAAAGVVIGAVLCSPLARATPVGGVEHFPTRCSVGALAAGPDGNVWFTCFQGRAGESGRSIVGRITPEGRVSEFSAGIPAGLAATDIVAASDGNLWVTLSGAAYPPSQSRGSAIGRVSPSGTVTVFRTGLRKRSDPREMVAGPEGNLWFADDAYSQPPEIGRITPDGTITEFPTGLEPPLGLGGLVAAPDGNVWFTEVFNLPHGDGEPGALIGRLSPSGTVAQLGAPPAALGSPIVGPDGNVWFVADNGKVTIDRVTRSGEITPFGSGPIGVPGGLAAGPDGNVWFTAQQSINRVTPSGEITRFTDCMDYRQFFSEATSIVSGPGGDLWFASVTSRQLPSMEELPTIGRVTPSGEITQFKAGVGGEPRSLLAGPDGRIWFAGDGEQIERITPPSAPVNTFVFGRGEARSNGGASLTVEVPDPGRIELRQLALVLPHKRTVHLPSTQAVQVAAPTCGPAQLQLRLRGAAKTRLQREGFVKIKVKATFTPSGGSANTKVATVLMREHRHRR